MRRFAACFVLIPVVIYACSDDETTPATTSTGGGGSSVSVGGTTSSAMGGNPLVEKENGEPCDSNADCLSDESWDGLCCNFQCDDECESCLAIYNGVEDGRCGAIAAGTDPEEDCTAACDGQLGANPPMCQSSAHWSLRYGVSESHARDTSGELIAADPAGNPYLVSVVVEAGDFGDGPIDDGDSNAENPFMVVGKLGEAGDVLRTPIVVTGTAAPQLGIEPAARVVSQNGELLFGGSFQGSFDFGGGTVTADAATSDNADGFVMRVVDDGAALNAVSAWAKHYDAPASGEARVNGVAMETSGDVAVVGYVSGGVVTFEQNVSVDASGGTLGYVARYDSAGAMVGTPATFPTGAGAVRFHAASFDDFIPQRLVLVGTVTTSSPTQVDFGCGSPPTVDGEQPFALRLTNAGVCDWVVVGSGATSSMAQTVVTDTGDVYLGGWFSGATLTFPNNVTLTNAGGQDGFVLKIDSSGVPQWGQLFGDNTSAAEEVLDVSLDGDGNVLVAGAFSGLLQLTGCSQAVSADSLDAFVACTAPDGSCCGLSTFGAMGDDHARQAVRGGGQTVLLTGGFNGEVDLGAGAMSVVLDGGDGYVGRMPLP